MDKFLSKARLLIFDFDGTLVDSNPIKLTGFDICFAGFEHFDEIKSYCHQHHHSPRWEKFRYVYEVILKKPYSKELEEELDQKYSAVTTQAVIDAPEIPGAELFLKEVGARFKTALLSGTPDEVLASIIEARSWRKYFNFVRGAPVNKAAWIKDLLKRLEMPAEQTVFFGDTAEDASSAREVGCPFVGVRNEDLKNVSDFFIHNFSATLLSGSPQEKIRS